MLGHGPRGVRSGRSVVLSAALVLVLVGVYRAPNRIGSSAREAPLARVAIDVARPGALIPPDFDGLSMEYPAVGAYLGATAAYPNIVLRRLLSNLGRGSLRIGGDSQDTSCWNPTGRRSRRGCLFNVGPSLPRVIFSTVAATHWRALVGLNLALNNPSDALTYVKDGILPVATPGSLLGLEIGNEPDLYSHHGLRPSSYSFAQYVREFRSYVNPFKADARATALPLVGPAFITQDWDRQLGSFITGIGASRLGFTTLHYYPFDRCSTTSAAKATISNLLAESTMSTMARQITDYAATARSHRQPLQMDEINSVACHGKAGVSDSFAAALWGLDALFTLARAGLVRVNFHIYDLGHSPGYYNPIVSTASRSSRGAWAYTTTVRPLYYAMLLFRNAVGRRFLPATINARANVKAYAVGDGATVRVFLLNKDLRASGPVAIAPSWALGVATVTVLRAPSPSATTGTMLGSQAINALTGLLPRPHTRTIAPDATARTYTVNLPSASVLMVTMQSAGTRPEEANPPRTDGAGEARAARCARRHPAGTTSAASLAPGCA
jgi:hypothetical protein